jgi:hypothetical protein
MKQVLFLVLLLAIMCSVSAQMGKNIVIDKPVFEDVYIAGGKVMLNAPVYGDLVVTGGTVTINDTVSSDILAAGGTIAFTRLQIAIMPTLCCCHRICQHSGIRYS